jgi:DNA-binding response OmpR family regulator
LRHATSAYRPRSSNTKYTTAAKTILQIHSAIGAIMIRLLIVEDQPGVRKGLLMRLRPDVVLMDVEMPRMDGIVATRALRRIRPQAAVIMLSIHDDALTRALACDAGAAAFVAKSMPADTLLTMIRQVAQQSLPYIA